ncbi:MAG: hypothetical protein FD165_353 [Gammaproteobacteria bacterium]|nr:MAG: hypothetical protein FD165_353 [Gammaproteobacteria bacterium]TND06932.1 MAG: hypothetical protein FD120_664 [Gammaproteobacteria bacterium]
MIMATFEQNPEASDAQRARLAWQCRRGMKELDLLLQSFLDALFDGLSQNERRAFDLLLRYPDPVLLEYLMGRMVPVDREMADVVLKIRRNG